MARLIELNTCAEDGNKRASTVLRQRLGMSNALKTQLLKRPEALRIDGFPAFMNTVLRGGERLSVEIPELFYERGGECKIAPCAVPGVREQWRDEDFAVFYKPPGVPVHPSRAHTFGTLGNAFAKAEPGRIFHPITRLDADTSGLVLVALNMLAADIERKGLKRVYYGVTDCAVPLSRGVIDAPLAREEEFSPRRAVREGGKAAVTRFYKIAEQNGLTLLRFVLETGRTHQIRAHCAARGFPLCGDGLYGGNLALRISRQALHAAFISFENPITRAQKTVSSRLPEDMRQLWEAGA